MATTRLIGPAGAFRAVPVSAGYVDVRGRGPDGDPGRRRTVRSGGAGQNQNDAALLLLHFLAALPIGALLGLAGHLGGRPARVGGGNADRRLRVLAGVEMGIDVLSARHHVGPLESAGVRHGSGAGRLRAGPGDRPAHLRGPAGGACGTARHRIVAGGGGPNDRHVDRSGSTGAWGLYRFNQILATLPPSKGDNLAAKVAAEAERYRTAFAMQYGSIFFITTIVCLAGANRPVHRWPRSTRGRDRSGAAVNVTLASPETRKLSREYLIRENFSRENGKRSQAATGVGNLALCRKTRAESSAARQFNGASGDSSSQSSVPGWCSR